MQRWLGVRASDEGQSAIQLTGGATTPRESSGAPARAEGCELGTGGVRAWHRKCANSAQARAGGVHSLVNSASDGTTTSIDFLGEVWSEKRQPTSWSPQGWLPRTDRETWRGILRVVGKLGQQWR